MPLSSAPPHISPLTRCQIEPLGACQFRFALDGSELTRWHFDNQAPRPYFFPINGPSGLSLTRMGHPGAPNHDHHRSFWFAHHDLMGISFWTEETPARIEQTQWYAIEEGNEFARIAFELTWRDGHDPADLVKQDVFVTLRPQPSCGTGAWSLELQCDFRAAAEGVEFRRSDFGLLGLRVAKSLSVIFGEGRVTGANGGVGERALFGRSNRWVDYSGPIGKTRAGEVVQEGLALIDHTQNPRPRGLAEGLGDQAESGQPGGVEEKAGGWVSWHVRDDGWMGPSLTRHGPLLLVPGKPLTCRYALLIHPGMCDPAAVDAMADRFDRSPRLEVRKGTRPHTQWEIAG